jgi:hypothetical protein
MTLPTGWPGRVGVVVSIELQVRSSIMGTLAARTVQHRLRTTCFPPSGSFYVDHADVRAPVAVVASGSALGIHVPVDVFVVSRDEVLAAPNAVPGGAMRSAGRITIELELATAGTAVTLRCVAVNLDGLAGAAGPAAQGICQAINSAPGASASIDLAPMLSALGTPQPASSSVELAGDVIAIRFEPADRPADRLLPDHEWGMVLDGSAVERMAVSRVPINLPGQITSFSTTPHWRPAGSIPHVDIDYAGKAQIDFPVSGEFDGTFSCDLSVRPTPAQQLRSTVNWSFHAHLGALVPGFVEQAVEALVTFAFDPRSLGGTPIGLHAFFVESRLPDLEFGGARFTYTSAGATPEGMTVGGEVRILGGPVQLETELSWDVLHVTVPSAPRPDGRASSSAFTIPHAEAFCSLGQSPDSPAILAGLKVTAAIRLDSCGQLCEAEVLSPGGIADYLSDDAVTPEDRTLRLQLPATVAATIHESVRLLVRTARGVRMVDLGTPGVTIGEDGQVEDAYVLYVDDCLYIPEHGAGWVDEHPDWNKWDPWEQVDPRDGKDWEAYVTGLRALDVQVVEVSGLQAGELVQFRSREHAVDVTADSSGRAVVPVLLSVRDRLGPAKLTTVSRRSLDGLVTSRTAVFHQQTRFPAGLRNSIATADDGTAVVTTEFADSVSQHEIGSFGVRSRSYRGSAAGGGPRRQSVPATGGPAQWQAPEVYLPGLASVIPVPGFEDQPIAIARMSDGSAVVLDLAGHGGARVAGTINGPVGELSVSGDWAMATGQDRVAVYRVTRH